MKVRNKIFSNEAGSCEYEQVCDSCTYNHLKRDEEKNILLDDSHQLYATKAEEYFFYFIPVLEKKALGIAI